METIAVPTVREERRAFAQAARFFLQLSPRQLPSRFLQEVEVAGAALRFRLEEGETVWTESSYKFEAEGIRQLVEPAGFVQRNQRIDGPGRFALTLFKAA